MKLKAIEWGLLGVWLAISVVLLYRAKGEVVESADRTREIRGASMASAVMNVPDKSGSKLDPDFVPLARLTLPGYDPPELRGPEPTVFGPEEFPTEIQAVHEKEITTEGFVLVSSLKGDEVQEVMLSRFPPGCCFGAIPVVDEWIAVEIVEPPSQARPSAYQPVRVRGRLEIGEVWDQTGLVESLYRMHDAHFVR